MQKSGKSLYTAGRAVVCPVSLLSDTCLPLHPVSSWTQIKPDLACK